MKHKTKKFIYNIVVILLLITGISWVFSRFIHLGRVEYTDNAQIRQLIVPVNSRVQGFIDKICFDEYRPVRKGDTLALIEDTEFRFRVAQAEADYQNALSGKSAMTTTINTNTKQPGGIVARLRRSPYSYGQRPTRIPTL